MTNSAILYVFNLSVSAARCHLSQRERLLTPPLGELDAKRPERASRLNIL